jgi:hypothetical protein
MDQVHLRAQKFAGFARWGVRTLAIVAVGGIIATAIPATGQAAGVVSQGKGRLVTAFIAGSSLDSLLSLNGAVATDPFGLGNVQSNVALDATALSALNVTVPGVNVLGSPGIIQLGAVGQYAGANNDGSSVAFSGTVSQASSLVGVGTTMTGGNVGTPAAGDSATVSVGTTQLLGGANLVQLGVGIGAVAASASQTTAGVQSGSYVVSNLNVAVGGDLLGTVAATLNTPLNTLVSGVNLLVGAGTFVNPIASGQISISLTDLLATAGVANINLLPAGTNLLTYLPAAVATKLTSQVTTLVTSISSTLTGLGVVGLTLAATLATLNSTILTPTLSTLSTSLTTPLLAAVGALLQLDVNNTSTTAGAFTQNALTIGLGTNGALARVGLANATVGPNAGVVGVTPVISGILPTSGPETGSTAVTITGTGFTGATGVTFGGTAGTSFVVVNDTTITAITPVHTPGPVNVIVQHPAGASNTFGFTFTPVISVTGIVPNSGPTTGNTPVTITGTCFTGATGVTFGGTAGTTFVVVDATHITVTTPAHATGAVNVVVQVSVACGGASTLVNGFTFIAPGGPIALGLTPPSGPASGGTAVTITGTNFTPATGVTFDGTPGTNFTVVNATTITVTSPPHAVGGVNVVRLPRSDGDRCRSGLRTRGRRNPRHRHGNLLHRRGLRALRNNGGHRARRCQ